MRRLKFKIKWEGQEAEVVVRELKMKEYFDAMEKATDIIMQGTEAVQVLNRTKFLREIIKRSIEKAPFKSSEFEELPISVASEIMKRVIEVNPLE